jgi:hypothetical protein
MKEKSGVLSPSYEEVEGTRVITNSRNFILSDFQSATHKMPNKKELATMLILLWFLFINQFALFAIA